MANKPQEQIVGKVNSFAMALLKEAQAEGTNFDDKLATFKELTRWIAIKHRINPEAEDGDGINDYRQQIREGYPVGRAPKLFGHGTNPRQQTGGQRKERALADEDGEAGADIASIRERIDARVSQLRGGSMDGGLRSPGGNPGGEGAVAVHARRSRLFGPVEPAKSEPERADSGGNV